VSAIAIGMASVSLVLLMAATVVLWQEVAPAAERVAPASVDSQGKATPAEGTQPGRVLAADQVVDPELPDRLELCGREIPLDDPEVRDDLRYELTLTLGRPLMPALWMSRAPSYLPAIEERLREKGLPDDLKYVAIVESDLRPWVESPAGALGLWQFMRSTAHEYGLRVDRYIDQRLDADRSTEAALEYLADLEEQFGDWFLALAAYNAGHNRVEKTLAADSSRNYFEIYLPRETRRYVLRLAAAKLVLTRPDHYGVLSLPHEYVKPSRIIEVTVTQKRVPLRDIAAANDLGYGILRRMNPQLVSEWLPGGRHRLRVPDRE